MLKTIHYRINQGVFGAPCNARDTHGRLLGLPETEPRLEFTLVGLHGLQRRRSEYAKKKFSAPNRAYSRGGCTPPPTEPFILERQWSLLIIELNGGGGQSGSNVVDLE
jgi:hypothetical protein